MLGLYIHIPFCAAICNYCNFNRGLLDPSLKVRYVEALEAHILNRDFHGHSAVSAEKASECEGADTPLPLRSAPQLDPHR